MDYGSLKNQGIYSGDGNKYRFGFQVWSSAKLLDNPPELDDGGLLLFFCKRNRIGRQSIITKIPLLDKKDMLEEITTKGHFSIFLRYRNVFCFFMVKRM